ncbi:MAG: hypothetical protein ABIH72_02530 [archaeon]
MSENLEEELVNFGRIEQSEQPENLEQELVELSKEAESPTPEEFKKAKRDYDGVTGKPDKDTALRKAIEAVRDYRKRYGFPDSDEVRDIFPEPELRPIDMFHTPSGEKIELINPELKSRIPGISPEYQKLADEVLYGKPAEPYIPPRTSNPLLSQIQENLGKVVDPGLLPHVIKGLSDRADQGEDLDWRKIDEISRNLPKAFDLMRQTESSGFPTTSSSYTPGFFSRKAEKSMRKVHRGDEDFESIMGIMQDDVNNGKMSREEAERIARKVPMWKKYGLIEDG